MVTASRVHTVMACLGSAVLEPVGLLLPASDRGTALHRVSEDVARYGREAALSNVPEQYASEARRMDMAEIAELAKVGALPEVSFAWSPSTDAGRVLGTNRDYSDLRGDEIGGTADLAIRAAKSARVIDYKTGYHDVDPPDRNWQLKTLALACSRAWNVDEVTVEIWKLREDGGWWKRTHTFDAFDLDAIAAEIRARLGQLANVKAGRRKLQLVEGDHCDFCPALKNCPAKLSLAASLVKQIPTAIEKLTPEEIGNAYDTIKRAQVVIDKIRKSIEELAKREPIPLPDGRTLALQEETREYVVGEVVREVVTEKYGAEVAARVCETTVKSSKTAIDRELGKAAKEVKEEIRRRGGMKSVPYTRLKAV